MIEAIRKKKRFLMIIICVAAVICEVVIYSRNQSYHNYVGQAVTFTLTMTDGTQMKVMAYNPFIVINGTGYKTKYEPCEKLNQYANRLVDEKY